MLDPRNIYRSKRRTLALFVDLHGNLIVKAPERLHESKIFEFVKSKQDWIAARQHQIKQNSYMNRNVVSYNSYLYMGQELVPVISSQVKQVALGSGVLLIPAKFQSDIVHKKIEKWYRAQAEVILNDRVRYFAGRLNMQPSEVDINNNKTRWGSCDTKRRINLNWRAVCLPPNLFDYIDVHEFCHLLEFNHTKNFWTIVETILPDWRVLRKHLKQMNWVLMLFRKQ
jgi:predicted metal-dependent hydrolase